MLLELRRIKAPREHVERTYEPSAFAGRSEDYRVAAPVALAFDLEKKGDRCHLVGRATTTLELACSRCLEPFAWPVDAAFDLRYAPQTANTGDGEQEVAEDDLDVAFYEGDTIDLGQLLREQFYLSLPMKPLCRAECLGLCPVCGTNRNTGACGCQPQWEDPRLAPLKGLLGPEGRPRADSGGER